MKTEIINKARYYYRKAKGDIFANKYIYYPNDLLNEEKDVSEVFTKIYAQKIWKSTESVSGKGSEITHTRKLIKKLDRLLKELKIKSMLDAPCGDFNWMQLLDKEGIAYTGMDIVEELIQSLQSKYKEKANLNFQIGNIVEADLPNVDLIFCRDCLVHLSFEDIQSALINFKKSGSNYLLTTTYIHRGNNFDIKPGGWRALNLERAPFHLPKPIKILWEENLDDFGMYYDKSMGLWDLSKLKI